MKEVAVYEAKTRLSELLVEVAGGEQVIITRRGVAVARLVAAGPAKRVAKASQRQRVAAVFEELRRARKGVTLDIPVRDAIEQGRD
ncbi:MAG: type II toxin-antitoxin system prevent-host-death family antitoxin [Burkholderiales bacterium]|nr:MAG: type II toxin-antitoxin system prevent-host-death family antitoxin [Burkholderiales bacterium]